MKASYLLGIYALAALLVVSSASTPSSSMSAFLSTYLSNASISSYNYYNVSLSGSSYVVAVAPSQSYVVINTTSKPYSLMTNGTAIDPILTSYFAQYENLSAVSYLNTAMKKYVSNAAANLSDCVQETASNPPLTNNFTNAINACASVPHCGYQPNTGLLGTFGVSPPGSVVGIALQNFSIEYGIYNISITSYFNIVQHINESNAGSQLSKLGTDVSNLSSVATSLSENPLFPPPQNLNVGECTGSGLATEQPWYCVAIGYCEPIAFNGTQLSSIKGVQQQLAATIPTPASISSYSSASAATSVGYQQQENQKINSNSYYAFLNATYPTYNATVAKINVLLGKSHDANLTIALSKLQKSFGAILSNGVNVSVSTESGSFNSVLASVIGKYNAVNQSFAEASSYSSNYTLDAITAQLNYKVPPTKLVELASQLQALDLKVASSTNETAIALAIPQLNVIGLQLAVYAPVTTMGYLVKLADGWFINAALVGSNSSVPSKLAAAPTYAALLSFIIGLIILILIYLFTHRRLSKKHKLKRDRRTTMAWTMFFVGVFILVLIYTYGTFAFAQAGNHFLPFTYFKSALHASKSAYIVLNGSTAYNNANITACSSALASVLIAQNKTVKVVQATNYSCVAGGTVSSLGVGCIDTALGKGTPVISLSSSGSGVVYKGLYGTILYASGANATGSSCIVAQLLSKK